MYKEIKVSIITVCYNAETTIEKTINSVLSQTYPNIEYIIIDGKSKDNTVNVINKYKSKIAKFVSEPDNGIYDAMNKGIKMATGDVIGIINADDWYDKDAVENILNIFHNSNAEIVYGKAKMIYHDQSYFYTAKAELEKLWYDVRIMHPTVFVKNEVYDKYGLFDLSYELAADYELILRYYIDKVKFLYMDEVVVNFTLGGKSTIEFAKGVKEVKEISLKYASKYVDNDNLFDLIENRYKEALFNMSLQGPSDIIKTIFEKYYNNCNEGIYIFGTGHFGKVFFRVLNALGILVNGFLDNNLDKQKDLENIKIYTPKILASGNYNVFIAVNNCSQEIVEQIKSFNNKGITYLTISELKNQIFNVCNEE